MTRVELLDWLLPWTNSDMLCIGKTGAKIFGWVHSAEEVTRCLEAWREGRLSELTVTVIRKSGEVYGIQGPDRVGVVLHRDGKVGRFALDYDCKEGGRSTIELRAIISRWLNSLGIVFASKSGRGFHVFYALREPATIDGFLSWSRSWRFNRPGQPECFPKTTGMTAIWLPNEPNEVGGDRYCEGNPDSATLDCLPPTLPRRLGDENVRFLRGECLPGERNERLNSTAFCLAQAGVPEEEARELCLWAAELCGLLSDEPEKTRRTFEDAYRKGGEKKRSRPAVVLDSSSSSSVLESYPNEYGLALRYLSQFSDRIRYVVDVGEWAYWNGRYWNLGHAGYLGALGLMPIIAEHIAETAKKLDNDKQRSALQAFAYKIGQKGFAERALGWAKTVNSLWAYIKDFDAKPRLLNFKNGTYDLIEGTLREHRKEDMLSLSLDFDYDPEAKCPNWDHFIELVTGGIEELERYFQVCVGCSLYGAVHERASFFLYGKGSNGKTVFLEVLRRSLGDYARVVEPDVIFANTNSESRYSLAGLRSKRFVVMSESAVSDRVKEHVVKKLTGGDTLLGRKLYQEEKEIIPQMRLYLATNHLPHVDDPSDAVWTRLYLLPFWHRIPADRKKDQETVISQLLEEKAGIILWAIEGFRIFQELGRKIVVPDVVQREKESWRRSNDQLAYFIEKRLDLSPDSYVGSHDLYSAYLDFWKRELMSQRVPQISHNRFKEEFLEAVRRLGIKGVEHKKLSRGKFWTGVKILDQSY